jgi:hypothetical protein
MLAFGRAILLHTSTSTSEELLLHLRAFTRTV